MKFGKALRLAQTLQWNLKWADDYVNYKLLKAFIKYLANNVDPNDPLEKQQTDINNFTNQNTNLIQQDNTMTMPKSPMERRSSVISTDSDIAKPNNDALAPADLNRRPSVDSTADDFNDIELKIDDMIAWNALSPAIAAVRDSQAAVVANISSNGVISPKLRKGSVHIALIDLRQKSFMEAIRREISKVENCTRSELKILRKRISDMEKAETKDNSLGPSERTELKVITVDIMNHHQRLENFFDLNMKAFQKILKKFDKKVLYPENINPKPEHLAVLAAPFLEQLDQRVKEKLNEKRILIDKLFDIFGRPSKFEIDTAAEKELHTLTWEPDIPTLKSLSLDAFAPETINKFRLLVASDALNDPICIPVVLAKGKFDGPVLGITAALHGNEINGIPLIHQLFRELDVRSLAGTLIAIPVLNTPGFLRHQRGFSDGKDLNTVFPGKPKDLHTAGYGRANSIAVYVDMNDSIAHQMARLQDPNIIIHSAGQDGSLRAAAIKLGIPTITVEMGDPGTIDRGTVSTALRGVENILNHFKMLAFDLHPLTKEPTICSSSFWIYAKHGGLLTIVPETDTWVEQGEVVARIRNMYGDIIAVYQAPCDAMVVGKNVDPVCATGDKVIRLGLVDDTLPVPVAVPKRGGDGE